jgi:UDPglucose 6-dehydrogenase
VSALIHTAQDYGYDAKLLQAAVTVNQRQRLLAVEKLQQILKILKGKIIGLLGLTFKPDTDDVRDTPARDLIEQLTRLGATVKAYDPLISQGTHAHGLTQVELVATPEALAQGCHALVLVTDWQEFQGLDYAQLGSLMRMPILLDGRNCLDPQRLAAAGFTTLSIGRLTQDPASGVAQPTLAYALAA